MRNLKRSMKVFNSFIHMNSILLILLLPGGQSLHSLIPSYRPPLLSVVGNTFRVVYNDESAQQSSELDNQAQTPNNGNLVQIPVYGVFELVLTALGGSSNPYLLMPGNNSSAGFVTGKFQGPNGESISIDGFWDGGNTWKIRMAPTSEGTWTYTTSSQDPGLNGKRGSFLSVHSNAKGFVRADPDRPHHFSWDDGTPFYWASAAIVFGTNKSLYNGSYQAMISFFAQRGFNHTWWGYTGFEKPKYNQKTQKNEGGDVFINFDPTRLNPVFHQSLDQRIQILMDNGFLAQIGLGWPDQGILNQIGHENLKRYWRYLIARYAAYNVEWNIFREIQEFGPNYLAIFNDYANLTRQKDPYDHMISVHTLNDLEPDLVNSPLLDYITLQRPTDKTSDYLIYGKPVVNSEYGGYENVPPPDGTDPDTIRKMTWDIRMRGGYFVYENWGATLDTPGARYSAFNNQFFMQRTNYRLLESHPELFNRPGLANPGHEYIVYLPNGGTASVNLTQAGGDLSVFWFNPRTGEVKSGGRITGGSTVNLTSPISGDVVLQVRKSTLLYAPLVLNRN